jgi:hypothetical protein
MIRPWRALAESSAGNKLVFKLIDDWHQCIEETQKPEVKIRRFLADNAGFFFYGPFYYGFAVAGLKLGGHQVDFMQPEDLSGSGAAYKLIKVRSPHAPARDADGGPTESLIEAAREVEGWRHWIESNRLEANLLFPSTQPENRLPRIS